MKLAQYVNFVFPQIIFRSSTWKNTQQSKFSNFSGSMSMKIWEGKLKGAAVKKGYYWFGLRLHSAHKSAILCIPAKSKWSKWDSKGIKSFSEM